MFQKAIGDQNLEAELEKLSKDPVVIKSIQDMEADLASGRRGKDPMSYRHNVIIKNRVETARRRAWGSLSQDADVIRLVNARKKLKGSKFTQRSDSERSNQLYDEAQELLKMYR